MKYDKCTQCGSSRGFVVKCVPVVVFADMVFDYQNGFKTTENVIDGLAKCNSNGLEKKHLYCRNCDKIVCTYGEMFEGEIGRAHV